MIDWKKIPKADQRLSDTALAEKLETTRQNVSAARKRLGWPPSPETRGGDRKSHKGKAETLTIKEASAHRAAWASAASKKKMTLNAWILATLNKAAK